MKIFNGRAPPFPATHVPRSVPFPVTKNRTSLLRQYQPKPCPTPFPSCQDPSYASRTKRHRHQRMGRSVAASVDPPCCYLWMTDTCTYVAISSNSYIHTYTYTALKFTFFCSRPPCCDRSCRSPSLDSIIFRAPWLPTCLSIDHPPTVINRKRAKYA